MASGEALGVRLILANAPPLPALADNFALVARAQRYAHETGGECKISIVCASYRQMLSCLPHTMPEWDKVRQSEFVRRPTPPAQSQANCYKATQVAMVATRMSRIQSGPGDREIQRLFANPGNGRLLNLARYC